MKRVLDLGGGLLLLIVVLSPIIHLDEYDFHQNVSKFFSDQNELSVQYPVETRDELAGIISEKSMEYILDKAEMLGMTVRIKIRMDTDAVVPYPIGVTLYGDFTADQKSRMSSILEQDLGITASKQEWIGD